MTSAILMLVHRLDQLFKSGHADHQHGRTNLLEVKEVLAEHEASIIRTIKENLGIDIRGDTTSGGACQFLRLGPLSQHMYRGSR